MQKRGHFYFVLTGLIIDEFTSELISLSMHTYLRRIYIIQVMIDAFHIDIFDMNLAYSTPDILKRFFSADPVSLPKKGILFRILAYFGHMLKSINPSLWIKQVKIPMGLILLYVKSKNQRYSLEPLLPNLDDSILFGNHAEFPFTFTTFIAHVISLPFFPIILNKFFQADGLIKEGFYYNFNLYWLTYGYYISVRFWLHYIKPKAIVFANDHTMENRVIAKGSKDEGIPTIYMQHASVAMQMPPLSFDYALLDGKDALSIYDKIGPSKTQVFLIGIPKFDKYFKNINMRDTIISVGICTNWVEPIDRAEELCLNLRNNLPDHKLFLRPHPQDKRMEAWEKIARNLEITYSDSKEEGVFDYLQMVDLILAGNSNIHLEAALVNVYPIYYDFSLNPDLETYSFVKNGLSEYISDPLTATEKILSLTKNRPNIRRRTIWYCNTVETRYDGYSSELACKLINQIASHGIVQKENWIKIDDFQLEAYEPSLSGKSLI